MKKNVVPAKASLTADDDAWFEALQVREFNSLPTSAWDHALAFWQMLPKAHPSTRRRLLMDLLARCADRRDAPPQQLVDWIGRELNVSKRPRARVRDPAKLREAAKFEARNPSASLEEIAAAIGIPGKKTTILSFRKNPEFKRYLSDEKFLFELEQAKTAIASGQSAWPRNLTSVHQKSEC